MRAFAKHVGLIVITLSLAASAVGAAPSPPAAGTPGERSARASELVEQARRHLARGTVDARRMALRELEQATLLDSGRADYELELARAYYAAGFLKSARTRYERVSRLAPEEGAARFGLGQVWRRDWLKYLDRGSLTRAIDNFNAAAQRDPSRAECWVMLSTLGIAEGNLPAATAAATRALEAAPGNSDAQLAAASCAWRGGDVERADSLFGRAVPRLARNVRSRFEDISPLATEQDTMAMHRLPLLMQFDYVRRFWKEHDPDPTTIANEAQLEYWARCAQAYFLYYDAHRREWDERGEVYVRYGPPDSAAYNPIGSPMVVHLGNHGEFPANTLVWDYRSLGMKVTLQDRLLSEYYLLPITYDRDPDPRPDPDSLAGLGEALATGIGRGVFPLYPPGAHSMPVKGALARFEGEHAPRLLAQLEVPGTPAESLWAEWVVMDSLQTEVARARRALSPSPCDPLARRTADFATALPPGHYFVGISVRGRAGARGVHREEVDLAPQGVVLSLSDVVITCGAPEVGAGAVQLAGNPSASVAAGDPLSAYFEIYHLAPGADGQAQFEYIYTVRSSEKDKRIWVQRALAPRREPAPLIASRREQNPGSLRRQFVTVPVQSLPPGRYRLEIRVRDLIAGSEASAAAEFVRQPPALAARTPVPTH